MNIKVDKYLIDGCMQCKLGGTPECKIHNWQSELTLLRKIALECGLTEDFKWMHPCYTYENKNIVLMHVFNNYCALLFPKGVLLKDKRKILIQQTENSQTARQIRFTNYTEIVNLESTIKEYIYEAIECEKAGLKVTFKQTSDFKIPEELQQKFNEIIGFKDAFYSLTPGRQRGYLIYFSQPKKAKSKLSRIDKSTPNIFNGKGLNDNYK
ncbi:MAG: DUF1801 domain-containing protein [Ignavibacteriae bacterium]|nr:DUF1801 domain-containing protein [Ignavibacteriota bacterium]